MRDQLFVGRNFSTTIIHKSISYLESFPVTCSTSERGTISDAIDWLGDPFFLRACKFECCHGTKCTPKTNKQQASVLPCVIQQVPSKLQYSKVHKPNSTYLCPVTQILYPSFTSGSRSLISISKRCLPLMISLLSKRYSAEINDG